MNYNNFLRDIGKDEISSPYIFIGEEEYLMKHAINILKEKYIDKSFETLNYIVLEGKDTDVDSLIDPCETLPFMNEKKLVVLKDVNKFIENIDKNREDELYKYMDSLGDFLILVFMDSDNSLKKNRKFYKFFKKREQFVEFSKLRGRDLNNWINSILQDHQKQMSGRDIDYFIYESSYNSRNVDLNLYDMENQLLKIIAHKKEETISRQTVDEVLVKSVDTNIFELLDAIDNFNTEKSIYILNQMYIDNEPIPKILFMIIRHIRLILGYKLYRQKGYSDKNIQDKLGIKSFEGKKISAVLNRFSVDFLKELIEDLLEADRKIKSTSIDDKLVIEMFLAKIKLKKSKK